MSDTQQIKNAVLIGALKGGTGKTLFSILTAYELQRRGYKVGLLDADIDSANVAEMLGIADENIGLTAFSIKPIEHEGVKLFSFSNISKKQHVCMKGEDYTQILRDVINSGEWGELDYLIIDLPAGSSDIFRSCVAELADKLLGFVIIAQPAAQSDFIRCISANKYFDIPIIGAVENMAGVECSKCKKITNIFGDSIANIAKEMQVELIGQEPLKVNIMKAVKEHTLDKYTDEIVVKLCNKIIATQKPPQEKISAWKRLKSSLKSVETRLVNELVKFIAEFVITSNNKVNINALQQKYGFTKGRVVELLIIGTDYESVLWRCAMRVRDGAIRLVEQPKQIDGTLVIPIDTLAKILLGKTDMKTAWLNGEIRGRGDQFTNTILFFYEELWNNISKQLDLGYFGKKLLTLLSESNQNAKDKAKF